MALAITVAFVAAFAHSIGTFFSDVIGANMQALLAALQ